MGNDYGAERRARLAREYSGGRLGDIGDRELWRLWLRTMAWHRLVPTSIEAAGLEPAAVVSRAGPRLLAVSR
jgi:hypothetical protein